MTRAVGLFVLGVCSCPSAVIGQAVVPFARLTAQVVIPPEGPGYSLASSRSAIVLPTGEIFLIEASDATILRFGPDGRYRGASGQRGSGPGEFRDPSSLLVRGDSVLIWDPGLSRLTLMTKDGTFKRTVPVRAPGAGGMTPSGQLFTVSMREFGGTGTFANQWLYVIARDSLGRGIDTLFARLRQYRSLRIAQVSGGATVGAQPFDDGPLSAVSRDGRYLVWIDRSTDSAGTFSISVSSLGGAQKYSRRVQYAPVALDRRIVEAAVTRMVKPGLSPAEVERALYTPRTLPPVTLAYFLSDGGLVLRREEAFGGLQKYTIIGPNGNDVATLALPSNVSIASGSSTQLLFAIRDQDGLLSYQLSRVP